MTTYQFYRKISPFLSQLLVISVSLVATAVTPPPALAIPSWQLTNTDY